MRMSEGGEELLTLNQQEYKRKRLRNKEERKRKKKNQRLKEKGKHIEISTSVEPSVVSSRSSSEALCVALEGTAPGSH